MNKVGEEQRYNRITKSAIIYIKRLGDSIYKKNFWFFDYVKEISVNDEYLFRSVSLEMKIPKGDLGKPNFSRGYLAGVNIRFLCRPDQGFFQVDLNNFSFERKLTEKESEKVFKIFKMIETSYKHDLINKLCREVNKEDLY